MMTPNKPTGETMNEGSDIPPIPGQEPDGDEISSGGEQPIPLKFLAQPDDKEMMQTPAEGDTVSFTVDATVTRIVGQTAFVKPSAINGNEIGETETPAADANEGADSEGTELRGMAEQMSQPEQD